jgi:hypothetical protein
VINRRWARVFTKEKPVERAAEVSARRLDATAFSSVTPAAGNIRTAEFRATNAGRTLPVGSKSAILGA